MKADTLHSIAIVDFNTSSEEFLKKHLNGSS